MSSQDQTTSAGADQTPAESPAPVAADAILTAVALDQAATHPDIAAGLRSYMESQERYIAAQMEHVHLQKDHLKVQMEHLHEQRELTLTHMRHQHFSDWLSSAWKVLLVILGTGVVFAAGWLVWDAKHDNGLVIEPFDVPEDLVAKGYTGRAVAERVLDHLKALQASSARDATRAASSYTLNWADNLKVEIPETGVSLGELNRFLRERFGHQTRISGEVVHTDQGLTLHVRAGEASGVRIDGAQSELEVLTERAAEKVYAQTQPYRYAFAISGLFGGQNNNRIDEALGVLRALAVNSNVSVTERAWAYAGLSRTLLLANADPQAIKNAALSAIQADPDLFDGYIWAGVAESTVGHDEARYQHNSHALRLLRSRRTRADVDPAVVDNYVFAGICVQGVSGDVEEALLRCRGAELLPQVSSAYAGSVGNQAAFMSIVHDIAGLRSTRDASPSGNLFFETWLGLPLAVALEDWSNAARLASQILKESAFGASGFAYTRQLAYATARLGDIDAAQKLIDATPTDCYGCLRTRGQIAAMKQDWSTAERWFSEAAKQGPSLPFANTEWGQMYLEKSDTDRAIAQFEEAIKRQAHFADPYQYWGEALMAKGDARGAISKFEQAVKYAPKWGRIQIQWGAALKKLGRSDEAQEKFAAAEALELVPSERALLTAVSF